MKTKPKKPTVYVVVTEETDPCGGKFDLTVVRAVCSTTKRAKKEEAALLYDPNILSAEIIALPLL